MDCRGHEVRKEIVQKYNVVPQAHLMLLHTQTKKSDAGPIVEGEYYRFTAQNRIDGRLETIVCGMHAACDFLELLGHPGLPLFNPLKEEGAISSTNNSKSNPNGFDNNWHPEAKQLYNAIMWLITIWDADPDTPLYSVKDYVVSHKSFAPFDSKIKAVNTMIKNGENGKTLTQVINNYRKYNNFKSSLCNFALLEARINEMICKKGYELKSFF